MILLQQPAINVGSWKSLEDYTVTFLANTELNFSFNYSALY